MPKPSTRKSTRRSASNEGRIWVLLPGGKPRLASELTQSELVKATAWCREGDGSKGWPWLPITDGLDLKASA